MKKQTRNLIILAVAVVLLVGAYAGVTLWNKAKAERDAQAARDSVTYVSQLADAVEITYSNESGMHTYLKDENGRWYLEEDPDFPLNGENLDNIEEAVMGLAAVYRVDASDDLDYYGLNDGKILQVTDSNGDTLDMVIGIRSSDQESYYVRLQDTGECFTIHGDLNRYTNKTLLDMTLLRERLALDEEHLLSITMEGKFGTLVFDKETTTVETEVTDETTGETAGEPVTEYVWYVTTEDVERKPLKNFDIPKDTASYSSADKFLHAVIVDDLTYMSFDSAVAYLPTQEQLEETGLDEPKYVLTLHFETDELLEDGTYAAETLVISVGDYVEYYEEDGSEIIPTMLKRYVTVEGDNLIYIMDEDDYEKLEMTYFEFNGHDLAEEPVGAAALLAEETGSEEETAEN